MHPIESDRNLSSLQERSDEAIHKTVVSVLWDCFAALAMTVVWLHFPRRHRMTNPPPGFLKLTGAAALSAGLPCIARTADSASVYDLERFGNCAYPAT